MYWPHSCVSNNNCWFPWLNLSSSFLSSVHNYLSPQCLCNMNIWLSGWRLLYGWSGMVLSCNSRSLLWWWIRFRPKRTFHDDGGDAFVGGAFIGRAFDRHMFYMMFVSVAMEWICGWKKEFDYYYFTFSKSFIPFTNSIVFISKILFPPFNKSNWHQQKGQRCHRVNYVASFDFCGIIKQPSSTRS